MSTPNPTSGVELQAPVESKADLRKRSEEAHLSRMKSWISEITQCDADTTNYRDKEYVDEEEMMSLSESASSSIAVRTGPTKFYSICSTRSSRIRLSSTRRKDFYWANLALHNEGGIAAAYAKIRISTQIRATRTQNSESNSYTSSDEVSVRVDHGLEKGTCSTAMPAEDPSSSDALKIFEDLEQSFSNWKTTFDNSGPARLEAENAGFTKSREHQGTNVTDLSLLEPIDTSRYHEVCVLSEGPFSAVAKAVDRHTLKTVVIKHNKKKTVRPFTASDDQEGFSAFAFTEGQTLVQLSHKSIIWLIDGGLDAYGAEILIFPYIEAGDLFDAVANASLDLDDYQTVLIQICEAIAYVHHSGIVHCDIKLENILIQLSRHEILLCDFGVAGRIGEVRNNPAKGTRLYMAPEILNVDSHILQPTIDMWALGILTIILLFGEPIWEAAVESDADFMSYVSNIKMKTDHHEPWNLLNQPFREGILKAIHPDPTRRSTIKELLAASKEQWLHDV